MNRNELASLATLLRNHDASGVLSALALLLRRQGNSEADPVQELAEELANETRFTILPFPNPARTAG